MTACYRLSNRPSPGTSSRPYGRAFPSAGNRADNSADHRPAANILAGALIRPDTFLATFGWHLFRSADHRKSFSVHRNRLQIEYDIV
jgi:hypothetical protein